VVGSVAGDPDCDGVRAGEVGLVVVCGGGCADGVESGRLLFAEPCAGGDEVEHLDGPMLTNMGGPMMDRGNGMTAGGAMRLITDRPTAANGEISFLVTNGGSVTHELVILPLRGSQIVGTRRSGDDGTIDETGSVGEASNSCGSGTGQGVLPGTSGWVTVTLPPGRYELVCNLPGHYAAGMYSQLSVD
jgi:uncharacterized cupredoxin-like copper-binding protein